MSSISIACTCVFGIATTPMFVGPPEYIADVASSDSAVRLVSGLRR
ncbi:hypothetical protein ACVWVY_004905 [Bradyrhizobium sp. URHC0002]